MSESADRIPSQRVAEDHDRRRRLRARRLPAGDRRRASRRPGRHHHRRRGVRHLRQRHQDVSGRAVLLGRRQGPAPLRQGAHDPRARIHRPRGRDRREYRPRRPVQDRRPPDLRADRALRALPLLQARRVLDVRAPRRLWFPEQRQRRHGQVHALPEGIAHAQDTARPAEWSARSWSSPTRARSTP